MLGFLNLNKPKGFTSHDCVAVVRRLLRQKQVGHGGTLDPDAIGVLPIALGRATRLLQFLPTNKTYFGTIKLGINTTTDDLAGEILRSKSAIHLDQQTITQALQQFQGKISQIPPKYSAIQVEGRRLYDLARSGIDVDLPIRNVEIFEIKIIAWRPGEFPELDVEISCGAGTYIRSIARDLGDSLGTGGTLAALTRTCSAGFALDSSISLEQLEAHRETWQPIAPQIALRHLPSITLPPPLAKRWCQGQKLPHPEPIINLLGDLSRDLSDNLSIEYVRVLDENGSLLGVGQVIDPLGQSILVPKVVLENQ